MNQASYLRLMANSFRHFTGRSILFEVDTNALDDGALAKAFWQARQAIVSHGVEADPVFCYGNAQALALWQMDWENFTRLPSRRSAEAASDIQADRDALLRAALAKGWVEPYRGVRVSSAGRRFEILDTVLWNVVDADGMRYGQAAYIRNWRFLP